MQVQVNSDKTISVDLSLKEFVAAEVNKALKRFEGRITRAEVHLSDIDGRKSKQADKRVVIEVRPAGSRPLSATAIAPKLASAVKQAVAKVRRELTTFYDRHPKVKTVTGAPSKKKAPMKKAAAEKAPAKAPAKKVAAKKAAAEKAPAKKKAVPVSVEDRTPGKKRIFQARRKPWPSREPN